MYDAGLTMLYLGIESGSDLILKKITKGAVGSTIIRSVKKGKDAGYTMSCMIILGIGGKAHSKEHIRDTAKVINACAPNFVGALTLYLENGIKEEFLTKFGEEFVPISDDEALDELQDLVGGIEVLDDIVFRANHGSNAYNISGTFPRDKDEMLGKISWLKSHPEVVRPAGLRGF